MKKRVLLVVFATLIALSSVSLLTACGSESGVPASDPYSQYLFTLNADGLTLTLDVKYKSMIQSGSLVLPTETYYYAENGGTENVKHDKALPVSTIADGAFENCGGLTSVTIGDSYVNIGKGSFRNCKGLTEVSLSKNVTSIPDDAFAYCEALQSVKAYNSDAQPQIGSIGARAFMSCMSLRQLELGFKSGLTIGEQGFFYTISLPSIDLTNAVTVESRAFAHWQDSQQIIKPADTSGWASDWNA